eukprot:jgi/Phyca11/537550/estExt2_fgenesh1_pg.C_PHYCAscaffold_970006
MFEKQVHHEGASSASGSSNLHRTIDSSINGDSKCEIIKKIFRQCPNTRKELISNRKEITEDEHGGEAAAGDFFNRERMDPRKGGEQEFGNFFQQRLLGRGDSNPFEGLEEFERMPMRPPSPTPHRPSRQAPSNPPHYSFQPSQGRSSEESNAKERVQGKSDMFADYSGRVEEI